MDDVDAVIDEMAAYLTERHVRVPREWLCGLREHIEENEPQYRDKMAQAAYWHLLETDLNTLECGSLPANIDVRINNISGDFFLQINSVTNICHLDDEDDDDEDFKQIKKDFPDDFLEEKYRVLDLELTDGVQTVSGMEWDPMPFLSANTKPGAKILVHGKVECRRGVLFLGPENTKFLGGEVEELAKVNNKSNISSNEKSKP